MKSRCYHRCSPVYFRYGGRGIVVCERWHKFENFLADMGERPGLDYSLDRIDNRGNYEPGNCRWATEAQQQRNRTNNHMLTFDGRTLCVTDWAKEIGLDPRRLFNRIARGEPLDKVLEARKGNRWKRLQHQGREMTLTEWAKEIGMSRNTLARKLKTQSLDAIVGG